MLGVRAETLRAARCAPVVKAVAVAEGETLFDSVFKKELLFCYFLLQHLY